MARAVVPLMQAAGRGAIVNLGSISSFLAQPEFVTYNASKAAIVSMTRCLALDMAPHGIRVNAVCPGTVWTPVVEQMARDEGLDNIDLTGSLGDIHDEVERRILAHLYPEYPSSRLLAKRLGVSHTTIANKLKRHGIAQE